MVSTCGALLAAVLALLVADTMASSAASSKIVWHSPSFEEAVVEASRRGQRRNEACLACCDKGCKTLTGAKKCEDLFGTETGEAAGTHADKSCKADGVTCVEDNGCLCIWLYNQPDNCPAKSDGSGGTDCTVLPDLPIHAKQSVFCARFARTFACQFACPEWRDRARFWRGMALLCPLCTADCTSDFEFFRIAGNG